MDLSISVAVGQACTQAPQETHSDSKKSSSMLAATCEAKLRAHLELFVEEVRAFDPADLDVEIWLPFAGGMQQKMADVMAYPYWNIVYHLGQINFIQTLYGDTEMR